MEVYDRIATNSAAGVTDFDTLDRMFQPVL